MNTYCSSNLQMNIGVKRSIMERQVKSKQRVSDFGEVYTAHRQVTDMLDMIPAEVAGINTTYLEPACGNGNFIIEILKRKFALITAKDPWTYSILVLRCVASVYGVDIQHDNTLETVDRIATFVEKAYEKVFHRLPDELITDAVRKIASRNIVWGNTLTGETGDGNPLSFHEWDIREDGSIMSKEYALTDMIRHNGVGTQPMCRHTYRWLTSANKETA